HRKRQVPAPEESADVAETGQLDAADRACRCRGSNIAHVNVVLGGRLVAVFSGARRNNTNVIKPEGGTSAGARVEGRGGLLPLSPAIFAHFMVSAGLTVRCCHPQNRTVLSSGTRRGPPGGFRSRFAGRQRTNQPGNSTVSMT